MHDTTGTNMGPGMPQTALQLILQRDPPFCLVNVYPFLYEFELLIIFLYLYDPELLLLSCNMCFLRL